MSKSDLTLVPFDHTYILYAPGSFVLSLPLAACSLLPILVLVFLFSWHILTRELEPCLFAFGHVCNDIISGIFKKIFKYPRPINGQIFKQDSGLAWGMPSSHSQFMAFWFTYTFFMYIKNNPNKRFSKIEKIIFTIISINVVLLVVASRIIFEYHNWNQINVGLLLGSSLACIYYIIVCVLREYGFFDFLLKINIFKWWKMKDNFGRGNFKTLEEERNEWERLVN
jgi:dolichyldiphosphatase